MGERTIVRFDDERGPGVGVYLHWHGPVAADWLKAAGPTMRRGDASYAAARFCGYCNDRIPGGLSLGLLRPDECTDKAATWQDHGMFIVDCVTGHVRQTFGGDAPENAFDIEMGGF
jgi:hypothetical protein